MKTKKPTILMTVSVAWIIAAEALLFILAYYVYTSNGRPTITGALALYIILIMLFVPRLGGKAFTIVLKEIHPEMEYKYQNIFSKRVVSLSCRICGILALVLLAMFLMSSAFYMSGGQF